MRSIPKISLELTITRLFNDDMTTALPSVSAGENASRPAPNFRELTEMHGNVFQPDSAGPQEEADENGPVIDLPRRRNVSLVEVRSDEERPTGRDDCASIPSPGERTAGEKAMPNKTRTRVKKKDDRRYNKVSVLFDETELPLVRTNAKGKGQSTSTYVRSIVREKLGLGDFGSVAAG